MKNLLFLLAVLTACTHQDKYPPDNAKALIHLSTDTLDSNKIIYPIEGDNVDDDVTNDSAALMKALLQVVRMKGGIHVDTNKLLILFHNKDTVYTKNSIK